MFTTQPKKLLPPHRLCRQHRAQDARCIERAGCDPAVLTLCPVNASPPESSLPESSPPDCRRGALWRTHFRKYTLICACSLLLLLIFAFMYTTKQSPPLHASAAAAAAAADLCLVPPEMLRKRTEAALHSTVKQKQAMIPALDLPQVDPYSDTDNTVNQFLLEQVRQGYPKTIAGGGWWGPTDQFFINQLWGITKSESGTFAQGDTIVGRVACLAPGSGNGYGSARNTLAVRNVMYNNARYRYRDDPLPNGEFITLQSRGFRVVDPGFTDPIRTQCFSQEGVPNIFVNGAPVVGEILRTGIKIPWWHSFAKPVLDNTPAGFNVMGALARTGTLKSVPIAAQAWYQHTGYNYTVLDSAVNAQGQFIPAVDLAGSTVNGTLQLHWYAMRGAREESHGSSDFQTDIHHVELRVEEGGEDYTYFVQLRQEEGYPLSGLNYKELYTDLDTRIMSDGWHIISLHSHAIDHVTTGAARGMQLAAELKVPICVENYDSSACEADVPPAPVPSATPTTPPDPSTTPVPPPTPMPTATAPIDPPGNPATNLLKNGDFSQGLQGWQWHDINGAAATLDGDMVILPLAGDKDTQLYQERLTLKAGQAYTLRITLRAFTNESELGVYVHLHEEPFTNFGLRETILVNTLWTTLEFPFVAKNFDEITSQARLRIRPVSGSFLIDSVEVFEENE